MSNKRITDLTELTTPTTDDVFPVVDIATNTTTKVQLGNLPVPTSVTTALATKENTITAGTTSQYYRGDKTFQTLDKTAVGLGNVDNTSDADKPVSTATQTALNAKQDTLVSGTNIKTINSTSLLGSGNITIAANPSGVAGAIQFSNGSAFASDASNLFWDDTNNRLGVGTNAPTQALDVTGNIYANGTKTNTVYGQGFITSPGTYWQIRQSVANDISFDAFNSGSAISALFLKQSGGNIGINTVAPTAKTHIVGSGSTSATTSLLVQNSSATELMRAYDDGKTKIGVNAYLNAADPYTASPPFSVLDQADGILAINQQTQYAKYIGVTRNGGTGDISLSLFGLGTGGGYQGSIRFWTSSNTRTPSLAMIVDRNQSVGIGLTNSTNLFVNSSAKLQVDSTTQGFLPPRMTNSQRLAIATPAVGLIVYCTDAVEGLYIYKSTGWTFVI